MDSINASSPKQALRTEDDPRWDILLNRRSGSAVSADFVYAVRTTGVYCTPGSPS
ncbi:Ada regulatory protein, partial [Pseudomonas syringae pv. actinidiae ICMP 19096]